MKILRIIDVEENYEYEINVSDEEYDRAQTDMTFASKLLEDARVKQAGPSNTTGESDQRVSPSISLITNENSPLMNTLFWSENATKLFINLYKDLGGDNVQLKDRWQRISLEMRQKGYNFTSKQCCTKLNSLKRTYKNIKDHNSKSGNDRKTWLYFDMLDEIFAKQPWATPLSTVSSSRVETNEDEVAKTILSEENSSKPKKRKAEKILEEILHLRREQKVQKQQHHEEKMKKIEKMNELLEKILNKAD